MAVLAELAPQYYNLQAAQCIFFGHRLLSGGLESQQLSTESCYPKLPNQWIEIGSTKPAEHRRWRTFPATAWPSGPDCPHFCFKHGWCMWVKNIHKIWSGLYRWRIPSIIFITPQSVSKETMFSSGGKMVMDELHPGLGEKTFSVTERKARCSKPPEARSSKWPGADWAAFEAHKIN